MMKLLFVILSLITMTISTKAQTTCNKLPMAEDGIIRYSVIEVLPDYMEEYLTYKCV